MSETAGLGRNLVGLNQPLHAVQNVRDRLNGLRRGIDTNDCIPTAEQQSLYGGKQDAAKVIVWVVRLQPNAEHTSLAHSVTAAGDCTDFAGDQDEVFITHKLG